MYVLTRATITSFLKLLWNALLLLLMLIELLMLLLMLLLLLLLTLLLQKLLLIHLARCGLKCAWWYNRG